VPVLEKIEPSRAKAPSATIFNIEIAAVATAVPENRISQDETKARAIRYYPQFAHMESLYSNTGIATRYCVEPTEWYLQPRTWEERTKSFQHHSLDLLEKVATNAIAEAGLACEDIDALVVNTITGLAIPSLDAMLMNRLPFRGDIERLPIFGFGCGGGVAGLARATRLAAGMPGSNVLFLTVDLCTLCLRINDPQLAMFVSAALFGDGAAAVVVRNQSEDGPSRSRRAPRIAAVGEHFWRDTERIMGWDIMGDGFGVVLSPQLPALLHERLGEAVDRFLADNGMTRGDLAGFLVHPGASKLLDVAERILDLPRGGLIQSRDTLRGYGNMSSATALFVLKQAFGDGLTGRHLLIAFGPGFSVYFVVVDL